MNWKRLNARYLPMLTATFRICRRSHILGVAGYVILGFAATMITSNTVAAQEPDSSSGSQQAESSKSLRLNYAGVSFNPSNRRDPFLNPLLKKKDANGDQEIDRGLPPPGIAGTFIEEAVLKGISIRENRHLAIVVGSGNRAYFLREGDKLFDGYLKAINRDSITLVRERKMRSGKVITQEVIKRLRTP